MSNAKLVLLDNPDILGRENFDLILTPLDPQHPISAHPTQSLIETKTNKIETSTCPLIDGKHPKWEPLPSKGFIVGSGVSFHSIPDQRLPVGLEWRDWLDPCDLAGIVA